LVGTVVGLDLLTIYRNPPQFWGRAMHFVFIGIGHTSDIR
jgi:hypothetical protein